MPILLLLKVCGTLLRALRAASSTPRVAWGNDKKKKILSSSPPEGVPSITVRRINTRADDACEHGSVM